MHCHALPCLNLEKHRIMLTLPMAALISTHVEQTFGSMEVSVRLRKGDKRTISSGDLVGWMLLSDCGNGIREISPVVTLLDGCYLT